jgi:chromosome segregation ATPase
MSHQLAHGGEPETDLDKTDELPMLDVAAYEARLAASRDAADLLPSDPSGSAGDEVRPSAPVPSPMETLRDIEVWIASQNARDRANEQALAHLRAGQADANTRIAGLATELDGARSALQVALARANDGERALLDSAATARAAEARTSALTAELERTRAGLLSATQRLADCEAELEGARRSIATSTQTQTAQESEQAELSRTLAERAQRMALLETELAAMRTRLQDTERELARRTESVTTLTAANDGHVEAIDALERARCAAEMRSSTYLENLQSHEWRRNVWEGMWRELDAELDDARTTLARLERERTELAGTIDGLRAELGERHATIGRLEASCTAQATTLRELAETRAQEERAYQAAALELTSCNAALVADVGTLEDARRRLAESLAVREADLADARSAHAALETALRAAQVGNTSQAARIAELEAITISIGQALQAQSGALQDATARLEASDREDAEKQTRIRNLAAELSVVSQAATERASAALAAEAALAEHAVQLAANRERLAAFERDAGAQAMRIVALETELSTATALVEQADAPRRALEADLGRVRDELAHESGRAVTLEAQYRELTLELERTRGALEERELRIRRLERHATTSAEALGRIKVGKEKATPSPDAEPTEATEISATLVPLGNESGECLPLNRRTTIGRATENDVCLKDTSISRHHALIVVSRHGSFIEDQESVNGVTVNGRRIRNARLADGDVITLGLRRFRFMTHAATERETH